jgi:hypothetical protein
LLFSLGEHFRRHNLDTFEAVDLIAGVVISQITAGVVQPTDS